LPELKSQYGDFSTGQQQWLQGESLHQDVAYWRNHLAGAPAAVTLPLDRPRPAVQGFHGGSIPFELPESLVRELGSVAKERGATTYMALLAVLQILLHRYSNQDDVVVGVPTANRDGAEIEPLIGCFVNMLPVRTDLSGDPGFGEVLERVRDSCLGAYAHQRVPFGTLVADLKPARDLSRPPIFQVSLSYQSDPVPPHALAGAELTRLPLTSEGARFDLELQFLTDAAGLSGWFEYDRDLFDESTIARMAGHFRRLVEQAVARPDLPVDRLPMLGDDDRRRLVEGNATGHEWPGAGWVHECVQERARMTPGALAVRFEGVGVSYAELNRRANRLARRLRRLGVGRDVLVGVCLERSVDLVVCLLAVLKAGGGYVPLAPGYPQARLEFMLADARPLVLLTERRLVAGLAVGEVVTLWVEDLAAELAAESDLDLGVVIGGDDLAYVLYTSGSTGRPKGVMNVHAALRNRLLWMQDAFELEPADRVLLKTPVSFDVSGWEVFWPLMVGSTLVVARPGGEKDSRYLVETIVGEAVTTVHFVPSMLGLFLQEPGVEECRGLRRVICSGERLTGELQARFFARSQAELHNLYGPTEAAIDVSAWTCRRDGDSRPVPIGFPIANVELYVLDRHLQPVPVGVAGELFIGGCALARGYLNQPELTAERFVTVVFGPGPGVRLFRTGDLARYRVDGALDFLGRLDRQVKVRGIRVELGEIESVLARHEQVREAIVVAREHGPGDVRLVAYLTGDTQPDPPDLMTYLKLQLPDYMIPAAFIPLTALPLMPNGKVDEVALPAPDRGRPELAAPFAAPAGHLERTIAGIWRDLLGLERVGLHDNFFDLGGHSLLMAQVRSGLAGVLGREVSMVELFQYPTVGSLAGYLSRPETSPSRPPEYPQRPEEVDDRTKVAIIGMAGRFPGAPDVEAFWENLRLGRESISAFSEEELLEAGVAPALLRQENYVKAKGVLPGADLFDADFFGYSPREVEIMDPQQRVFLECAWEALESAGCDPQTFEGRIGVFGGTGPNTYLLFNLMSSQRAARSAGLYQTLIANEKDFLATRVSYKLGLKGPSLTVQTACSTSLTAVHLARQSLLAGECDIALAGGVSVSVPLKNGYEHEHGGILSSDGHCRAFDARADGTVSGNGVGIVVLRRLAQARRSGDRVSAVISASAINNDGSLKAGFTAPSAEAQAAVITHALAAAGVDPAGIGYVETHGTGTHLGDAIEIAALTRVFREHTSNTGFCALGSVKTSVGHLDAAAGVTSLIKAALALQHEAIPATLNYTRPNPELALESSPFVVNAELRAWPRQNGPRRAAVSSFGIGGTNVHLLLEEAPVTEPGGPTRSVQLLPLSARTAPALQASAHRLADYLEGHPDVDLGDVAFTLARRRRPFECREAIVGRDRGHAVSALRGLGRAGTTMAAEHKAPIAFLFPGQGTQYVGMARDLYQHETAFAGEFDRCAELFAEHLDTDLRTLVFGPAGQLDDAAARLAQPAIAQAAVFAVEYALARLWRTWGVQPQVMVGHSIGEYVAATLAGVFSLEDAVRLVGARGRLVQGLPPGGMLAVFLPESQTMNWIGSDLSLAAVNSTALCVVSGPVGAVDDLQLRLTVAGVANRRLHTSRAFHSASMDAAVGPFVDEVRRITLNPPQIPFCSNVSGTWITDQQATSPEYWGAHLRQTVRFGDAIELVLRDPTLVMLEVGPGQALSNFVRQHAAWPGGRQMLGSLRHPNEKCDDREYLLQSLGALWSAGVPVNWAGYYEGEDRRPLELPGYAFQRKRYWVDGGSAVDDEAPNGTEATVEDWFYTPGWTRLPPQGQQNQAVAEAVWVVLGAELALGRRLADRLEADGRTVIRVSAGDRLRQDGDRSWLLDRARREHYAVLVEFLNALGSKAIRVLHLWSLGCEPAAQLDEVQLDRARRSGLDSLLALAQAIGDVRPQARIAIDVLSHGLYSVTDDERLQPENAPLLGACTVIGQEVPDVNCRVLDLTGSDPGNPGEDTVRAIHTVLGQSITDGDLALRGQRWWVRGFDLAALDLRPDGRTGLRDGGVYLITGGLGGVGLALAEHLARSVEAPVLGLLGRSGFPAEDSWAHWVGSHDVRDATSERIHRLRQLQELGARILVLQADVTDLEQTTQAVAQLRHRFGALNGVIHAAGVPSRGLIAGKSAADVDGVLAAKTRGTLVLDRVCRDDDCDFVLLCSSLTSVLGGPGQSDYAGANAFLDVFAQWKRRETGAPISAVAWDTWHGVGMAANLTARLGVATTFRTADHWVVDEHRITGHGVVPATAYLELVRAAVAQEAGGRVIELRDVVFTLPVVVPDGQAREVYTTIDRADDQLRFVVRSRAGTDPGALWQQHVSGSVSFPDRGPEVIRDLDEVLRQCDVVEVIDDEDELGRRLKLDQVEPGRRMEFSFGPRWRCLRRIQAGERRLFVTLQLDDAFLADLDRYPLHPALLDVAGSTVRIFAQDVHYLPFGYRSVRIRSGLTSTVHCQVELKRSADSLGETLTCDLELLDPDGRLLVQIEDFTIRRINDLDGVLDQIERSAMPPSDQAAPGSALGPLASLSAGLSAEEGVAAFARILAAPSVPAQLVVSRHDLRVRRRLARSITPSLLVREVEQMTPLGGTHPRPDLATPYVAPVTDEEKAIAAIWQDVLGIHQVGVDDDLFALGGHSLAAVQIGARIQRQFGVQLGLREVFDSSTVAELGAVLAETRRQNSVTADQIQVLRRDEPDDDLDQLSDAEVQARLDELLAAGPDDESR
jgi:amino acid adenylation domain-containing protein